jgi:hypothetical protein
MVGGEGIFVGLGLAVDTMARLDDEGWSLIEFGV